jgi:hypothetical protein
MKLSLTKALRLRSELEERVKAFDLKATVDLDVDSKRVQESAAEVVEEAAAGLTTRLATFSRLSGLLSAIRVSIAKANAQNGVEEILAKQGDVDRQIAKLKQLLGAPRVDMDSLQSKIYRRTESLKSPVKSGYGYAAETATVQFNAVSAELASQFEQQLIQLRRQKVELEDERTVANARTDIEIGADDHALLIEQGII